MCSTALLVAFLVGALNPAPAQAQQLSDEESLACQAILCRGGAALGVNPVQCVPSLKRFFSISFRFFIDTLRGRINFLRLCPISSRTPDMEAYIQAVANGAGRCDAASLNTELLIVTGGEYAVSYIDDHYPDYCVQYTSNKWLNIGGTTPKYVGKPLDGGYWVEAQNYDAAVADYLARHQPPPPSGGEPGAGN